MRVRLVALSLLLLAACKKDAPPADPEPAPSNPEPAAEAPPEPEAKPDPKPEAKPEEPPAATKDLVAVLAGLDKAKTFAELVKLAELEKDLHSPDVHLTILVPTDAAFDALPKGTLDKWKKNKDQLAKALKFHFVTGVNNAQKLGNFRTAPTATGVELEVKASQDTDMTIQGGRLIDIDIEASNGMVHTIDKVLQPGKK